LDSYFRLLALYVDIRCYDVEIRKNKSSLEKGKHSSCQEIDSHSSMISNLTANDNIDHVEEALRIAIEIFDEYIRYECFSCIDIDDQIKVDLF
jgi:hypothetical protein